MILTTILLYVFLYLLWLCFAALTYSVEARDKLDHLFRYLNELALHYLPLLGVTLGVCVIASLYSLKKAVEKISATLKEGQKGGS
jgi:hypothetical protein